MENTNTENQHKNDAMPHDKQQLPIAAKDKDFMTNHSFTTLPQREPTKPAVTVCQTIVVIRTFIVIRAFVVIRAL